MGQSQSYFPKIGFAILPILFCLTFLYHPASAQDTDRLFYFQPGTPVGIQNFVQIESGCNFAGIGGQVFDVKGSPITGLVIELAGTIEGSEVLLYAVTGGALQFGAGGFLLNFADHPVSSNGALSLQVLDVTGLEVSPQFALNTFDDCSRNLLLVNIKEIQLLNPRYFPFIRTN